MLGIYFLTITTGRFELRGNPQSLSEMQDFIALADPELAYIAVRCEQEELPAYLTYDTFPSMAESWLHFPRYSKFNVLREVFSQAAMLLLQPGIS